METAIKTKKKTVTVIDRAKAEGCFHCGSARLAPGKTEGGEKSLTCGDCGCEHTESSYEYSIPVASFERKVDVSKWNKSDQ